MYITLRRFTLRCPVTVKSSGNGSIGIDLTSKKDSMEKYSRNFENELIKVPKSCIFDAFRPFVDPPRLVFQ